MFISELTRIYWISTTFQIPSSSKDIYKVLFTKMSAA
nr:unnamed protein product [Callosobruchus analis]